LHRRLPPQISRLGDALNGEAAGTLIRLDLDAPPLMMDIRQVFSMKRQVSPSVVRFAEFLRKQQRRYLQPDSRANAVS